jgi:predicted O-methyltransferase YrrM
MPETTWHVLDLLLASEKPRPVAEIVTAIGSAAAVADALDTLRAAGLAGRMGVLVFVTSAPHERR